MTLPHTQMPRVLRGGLGVLAAVLLAAAFFALAARRCRRRGATEHLSAWDDFNDRGESFLVRWAG